jgi:hypothetical protein
VHRLPSASITHADAVSPNERVSDSGSVVAVATSTTAMARTTVLSTD